MNTIEDKIEKICSNWNTSSREKGDALFALAKEYVDDYPIYRCVSFAREEYEMARLEGDTDCLCNLAHCYYVLAFFSYKKRCFNEAKEYHLKSIETHIDGSRNQNYQNEDFFRFYSVTNEAAADSILSTIMLSSPQVFNDPVDCPIVQENSEKFFFPDKTVFDGLKVCCFGQDNPNKKDKIPFFKDSKKWAYYGDMHKGICVRYHFLPNELEKVLSKHFVFSPVKYESKFSFERGIVADGLLRKSDHYKDENEWRIVWFDRDYKSNEFYNDKRNCIFVPVDICNITSIYLGYRCPDNIVSKVLDFAKKKKDEPISVYRIQPDPNNLFRMTEIKQN